MSHGSAGAERDDWMNDNTRGLSLAAAADWDEAAEAFAAAADVLARRAPDVSSHDALALILGNLAQACFRAGRTDDALLHAQRACAIRVALAGEDGMPVARGYMDMAVMLGGVGRLDEAQALMQRAISAVERHVGDEDARLTVMLENAARLALAAGAPASAEPLLWRLRALLDSHGMPTGRADRLLAMVATARSHIAADETPRAVDGDASLDWDDQPLRDAVAMTNVLLRNTPAVVIAIKEPVPDVAETEPEAVVDITLELLDDYGAKSLAADPSPWHEDDGISFALEDAPENRPDDPPTDTPVDVPVQSTAMALAVTGPVVTGPVVTGPVVTGPVVTGPVVTGLVVTGPVVTGPVVTGPVVPGPDVTTPMATSNVVTGIVDTVPAVTAPTATPVVVDTKPGRRGGRPRGPRGAREARKKRVVLIAGVLGAIAAIGGVVWYFLFS